MNFPQSHKEKAAREWANLERNLEAEDIERADQVIGALGMESDELFAFLAGISLVHDASVRPPQEGDNDWTGLRVLSEEMVYSLMAAGGRRYVSGVPETTMPGQYL